MDCTHIIESLARHEESIGELYSAYAHKFPEYYDFWATMSQEEMNHAGMLRGLSGTIQEGSAYFNENRFRPKTLEVSIEYIQNEITRTHKQKMDLVNALSIALQIEQAMIERKYFEVVEGISPDVKQLLRDLAVETEEHIKGIQELWATHK